eukprot:14810525-Alexandrium_andersonii.AAC.1
MEQPAAAGAVQRAPGSRAPSQGPTSAGGPPRETRRGVGRNALRGGEAQGLRKAQDTRARAGV